MKKILSLLSLLLTTQMFAAENLLQQTKFENLTMPISIWRLNSGSSPSAVTRSSNANPEGKAAFAVDFKKCSAISLYGLRLVPGAKYVIGGWVKTSGFVTPQRDFAAFYITNSNWSKDVKTRPFPADTNGQFVKIERIVTIPPSPNGSYNFTIFGAKSYGNLEISDPFIIPVSENAASGITVPKQYDNLIRNPELEGTETDLGIWNNNLSVPGAVQLLQGAGPGGMNAVRLSVPKAGGFSQIGIKLVPGEKYRLGGYVRISKLKNPSRDFAAFYIANAGWTRDVKTAPFPATTNGSWICVERIITAPPSNGLYSFVVFVSKSQGEIDICYPYIVPVTEKGARGAAQSLTWEKDLPRVIPYAPLLSKIPAKSASVKFCTVYPVPGEYTDYRCEVSIPGCADASADFSADGLCTVKLGDLQPGDGKMNVRMVEKSSGKVVLDNTYSFTALEPLPPFPSKRLNNFVTLLIDRQLNNGEYNFVFPDDGWCRIAFSKPLPGAKAYLDGSEVPVIEFREGERSETMRYIKRGLHTVKISGADSSARITISKVPELPVFPFHGAERSYYSSSPDAPMARLTARSGFKFDLDFIRAYIWPTFNTYFMNNRWRTNTPVTKAADVEIRRRGIAILACEGFPKHIWRDANLMVQDMHVAESTRTTSGRCLDETTTSAEMKVRTALSTLGWLLQDYDKIVHTWMDVQFGSGFTYPKIHRPQIAAMTNISRGRGRVLMETYILTKPTAEACRKHLEGFVRHHMQLAKRCVPDAPERFMYVIGAYQVPGTWCANCYPHINQKYFYDMFLKLVATDPEVRGLAGMGCYSLNRSDEELNRYISDLFRHYCIEGNTTSFADKLGWNLIPGHLKNGDFEQKFAHWQATPAGANSLRPHRISGYGKNIQCRRVIDNLQGGDTCAIFVRSNRAPNKLAQTITGLTPGKLYTLMYTTADPEDVERPKNRQQKIVFHATLEGAEVLRNLSWEHRAGGNEFQTKASEVQTVKLVFRPASSNVRLTFSDWLNDREIGNADSSSRVLNFVSVMPYYEGK